MKVFCFSSIILYQLSEYRYLLKILQIVPALKGNSWNEPALNCNDELAFTLRLRKMSIKRRQKAKDRTNLEREEKRLISIRVIDRIAEWALVLIFLSSGI